MAVDTKSRRVAEIIDNIRRVFQVVNEHSKRAEKETGITGPQLWAIKTIAEFAPIKGAELARRMYLHPTTVVGILDRLEARGLVVKNRSTVDRRIVEVELTEQGKALVASAPEVAQGMLVKGLEPLPDRTLLKISDGLDELVRILGAKELPPNLILSSEVNAPVKRGTRSRKP
ncbi:MarR family transcriptional regulator [Geomonas limicola]|uniref:MarR family transcriptional regulator n=1 Tax=Geomonas limicola TaxID=2740186 RepID=A0A6V8NCR4_9BACT|nr:MarR family transcriptional regulator [Geomonas limicola]GFO70220.1 MarR family transcriptional regulator [Geomonas limicola]